tara:strand:+ start:3745 stop:3981 length:237 start_codon:yes stop_codon:yes gene_type:complete
MLTSSTIDTVLSIVHAEDYRLTILVNNFVTVIETPQLRLEVRLLKLLLLNVDWYWLIEERIASLEVRVDFVELLFGYS